MKIGKSVLYKIVFFAIILIVAVIMFIIGRGHTVYLDNKTLDYEGTTYEAMNKVEVYINGERIARLNKRERGMATWIGQNFKMELKITEKKGGDEVSSAYSIKLPYSIDGIVINLPAFLAGLPEEAYMSVFVPLVTEEVVEEDVVIDEFALTDEITEAAAE